MDISNTDSCYHMDISNTDSCYHVDMSYLYFCHNMNINILFILFVFVDCSQLNPVKISASLVIISLKRKERPALHQGLF